MIDCVPASPVKVSQEILERWQGIVDLLAQVVQVPAALIMRLVDQDIEVFVASRSAGNPYKPGDHEHFLGSGLYCETVVRSNDRLLVPNALEDEHWKSNPDVRLNMISYLGMPLSYPDGRPFGTICMLDSKGNAYNLTYESLLRNFRDIIQSQLELIYVNRELGEENRKLTDHMREIQVLRGMVPICSYCKSIRSPEGEWRPIDNYLTERTGADFSHSICDHCMAEHYPEQPTPSGT